MLNSDYRSSVSEKVTKRTKERKSKLNFINFFQGRILLLKTCGKFSTAANYQCALSSLQRFLKGKQLFFYQINPSLLENYNDWLHSNGLIRNSISFHMRILRAVYNKGIRINNLYDTKPFDSVYTGVDKTKKRAIGEDLMHEIALLNLQGNTQLELTRDIFIFSFLTRGMAFVDIAYLRNKNISGDHIHYERHKTGTPLSVKIESSIRKIIDKYYKESGQEFLFPILKGNDKETLHKQYRSALRNFNYRLKTLSEYLGLNFNLTSYMARHTWATVARDKNVPIAVISAGMGHSSERTTQTYLNSLENKIVDMANLSVIEKF